jgi:hypothetical protein
MNDESLLEYPNDLRQIKSFIRLGYRSELRVQDCEKRLGKCFRARCSLCSKEVCFHSDCLADSDWLHNKIISSLCIPSFTGEHLWRIKWWK